MGYRGDDASRARTDSRRQEPWQPYEDYGQAGYATTGGYTQSADYGSQQGGQHRHGSADGYGSTGGYGSTDGYADADGYRPANGYANGADGAGRPGAYGDANGYREASEYGDTNGYSQSNGYGQTGGHPDNDWYGGKGGSGFADTSTNMRAITDGMTGGYPVGDYGTNGYGTTGGNGYEPAGGHETTGGHGITGGYQTMDGYSGGYAGDSYGSGAYPAAGGGYGTGGYPDASSGGYQSAGSGAYPAAGSGAYQAQRPPRAALSAPPQLDAAPANGLVYTGQQEVLDDSQYETYPGYENVDAPSAQGGYGASGGYPVQQGYDDYDDYADPRATTDTDPRATSTDLYGGASPGHYSDPRATSTDMYADHDAPAEFGAGPDFGTEPGFGNTAVADDYADGFGGQDPYQERYGDEDAVAGGNVGDRKQGKNKKAKNGKAGRPGQLAKGGKPRGRRKMMVSAVAAVCLVVALGAVYTFVIKPMSAGSDNNVASANAPLPSPGSTSATTQACVKQMGQYCHIEFRTGDPTPLTIQELFPPVFANEKDHTSFQRVGTRMDTTCSNAVKGQSLISALQSGKCTQVARASYVTADNKIMGTIGIANLITTHQAHLAGKAVGANDIIAPLSTSKGITAKLGQGTGIIDGWYKGHYLIVTWAEFTNLNTPSSQQQKQELQQFEDDLVAGTVNISLSQRMVNGKPSTSAN